MKKGQKKSVSKKHNLYTYLLIIAMFAMLPLLRYTPFTNAPLELHKSAPESAGRLTVNMPLKNAAYVIFNNNNNELVAGGSDFTKNFDLPAGNYRIEFAEVNGYKTPEPRIFSYDGVSDFAVEGTYIPSLGYPLLGIKVFPENAKYIISDSQGKKIADGTGSQFFQMPNGNYSVEFSAIPGFSTPEKRDFFVANGVIATIIAVYGQDK
jgi:hypothetical protein